MGLAASQARFLGLTARKSNIEYQGQQINQARTALSNEVMNLYEKYNRLDVPVPPSVNNYTKTVYTVDSTYENYQITGFSKITSGEYKGYYNVNLSYEDEIAKAYIYTAKDAIINATKSGDTFSKLSFTIGTNIYTYDAGDKDNSTITKISGDYSKYEGLQTIMKARGYKDGTVFYMYRNNNTSYYTTENDLKTTAYDEHGVYYGNYNFDYQGTQKKDKTISAKAALTQEASGRLSTITVVECKDDPSLVNTTHSITTGSQDDQRAYEDAMNQYYYAKQRYEQQVETINKKTEKLQAEDKALELKLNQLDTEQKAISTEMDSVTKVIEDTIDSVFKTFNS